MDLGREGTLDEIGLRVRPATAFESRPAKWRNGNSSRPRFGSPGRTSRFPRTRSRRRPTSESGDYPAAGSRPQGPECSSPTSSLNNRPGRIGVQSLMRISPALGNEPIGNPLLYRALRSDEVEAGCVLIPRAQGPFAARSRSRAEVRAETPEARAVDSGNGGSAAARSSFRRHRIWSGRVVTRPPEGIVVAARPTPLRAQLDSRYPVNEVLARFPAGYRRARGRGSDPGLRARRRAPEGSREDGCAPRRRRVAGHDARAYRRETEAEARSTLRAGRERERLPGGRGAPRRVRPERSTASAHSSPPQAEVEDALEHREPQPGATHRGRAAGGARGAAARAARRSSPSHVLWFAGLGRS